jgi:hypothetical protein
MGRFNSVLAAMKQYIIATILTTSCIMCEESDAIKWQLENGKYDEKSYQMALKALTQISVTEIEKCLQDPKSKRESLVGQVIPVFYDLRFYGNPNQDKMPKLSNIMYFYGSSEPNNEAIMLVMKVEKSYYIYQKVIRD